MERISRTEGMARASSVASGTILGDFVGAVPLILYGLLIVGTRTCFSLPRAGMPLLDVDPANATHVSL